MTKVIKTNELYETKDLLSVLKQCEMTRKYRLMTGLLADTGMGKSTSLKIYEASENNVFMVTAESSMNAKTLFLSILERLNVSFDGNVHRILLKIAEVLNAAENSLLIIDEAGKLNHVMMLYLHVLRERTMKNCGILLAGMPYFKTNLERFSQKQKSGCSEFLRRINIWNELGGLSRKEIEYICRKEGMEDDFRDCYGLRFGDLMNKILLNKIETEKL